MSFITFNIFNCFPELICVFSKRRGGESKGIFSSFNMGFKTGDLIERVESNRNIFFNEIGVCRQKIAFAEQIHSAKVTIIDKPGLYRETDAMICGKDEIFLSILTADCFPIFIYVPKRRVVAVVHAGWRGVLSGIVQNVFRLLLENYNIVSSDIYVVVGPGIQHECFEVRKNVYSLFPKEYLIQYGAEKKIHLNLQYYILHQLKDLAIQKRNIYTDPSCTKCMYREYFSHRRDGEKSGRMMGIIGIKKGV